MNANRDTLANLFAEIEHNLLKEDLISKDGEGQSVSIILKDKNSRIYPVICREIEEYIKKKYADIAAREKGASLPLTRDCIKAWKLDQKDQDALFQTIDFSDITDSKQSYTSGKITTIDFSTEGFPDSTLLLPIARNFSGLLYAVFLPCARDVFTAMLAPDKLKSIAGLFSQMFKKNCTPENIKQLYIDSLNAFKMIRENKTEESRQILSNEDISRIFELYKEQYKKKGGTFGIVHASVILINHFFRNTLSAIQAEKQAYQHIESEKNSVEKQLILKARGVTGYRGLAMRDISDFQTSDGTEKLRQKFENSYAQMYQLIPTSISRDDVPGFTGVPDQIPRCIVIKDGDEQLFFHRWTLIYLLSDIIARERDKISSSLVTRWINEPDRFKNEKDNLILAKSDIPEYLAELIDKCVEYRLMYSPAQLSVLLIPDLNAVKTCGIAEDEIRIFEHIIKTPAARKQVFEKQFERLLFSNPFKDPPAVKPFAEIFEIEPRVLINANEELLIRVSFTARLLHKFKKLFGKKENKKKTGPVRRIKRTASAAPVRIMPSQGEGSSGRSVKDRAQTIKNYAHNPGEHKKIIDELCASYFIEAGDKMQKPGCFTQLAECEAIRYDSAANLIYLESYALSILKDSTMSAAYKKGRIVKLEDMIKKTEKSMTNDLVLKTEKDKTNLAGRKLLLAALQRIES